MNNHGVPSYFDSLANNTTKGSQSGSITFGKNPACQHMTSLSEFIAKQVPCRSGLFLQHEANVKTLFVGKNVGMPYAINSPFCCANAAITVRQSKSIEDREIGKQFGLCGENWLTNSNFSSLMEMTKVHSSSERSMLVHNFSAFKIEETELENQCSNLPLLEVDTHLPLLHLSCLFLVVLLKCCNVFSLKPTRPMCVGRPFASPLFRRLAGRGAFFCGFPFRWVLRFVLT